MPSQNPRKRPAPSSVPVQQQDSQPQHTSLQLSPQLTNEQFLRWGQGSGNSAYPDPSANFSTNIYGGLGGGGGSGLGAQGNNFQQASTASPMSNQLTRRSTNQQLVSRG